MSEVLTFGSGECEQLGLENCPIEIKKPRPIPVFSKGIKIKEMACGGMHTIAVDTRGRVYTWGCNDEGALGRGGNAAVPEIVTGLGEDITNVTWGDSHSIAYSTTTNEVYSWGLYRNSVSGPIGEIVREPIRIGQKNLKGLKLKKIASGSHHTLMLASGRVFAWGDPESGKIGRNIKTRRRNESGLVMQPVGLKKVTDIFASRNASFAISEDTKGNKNLYSWGLNNWGQLGLGHNTETSRPEVIKELKNKNVIKVAGGDSHTLILVQEGTTEEKNKTTKIFTIGLNDEGQLGIGDTYSDYRNKKNETNAKLQSEEDLAKTENDTKVKEIKEKDLDAKAKQKEINKEANILKKKIRSIENERNSLENSEGAQYFTTPQLLEGLTDAFDISCGANYSYAIRQRHFIEPADGDSKEDSKEESKEESKKEEEKKEEQKEVDFRVNQVYSWGMGENYVLCNRSDDSSFDPHEVNVDFFKELNPISIACGTMHWVMRMIKVEEKPEEYGLEPISEKIIVKAAKKIEEKINENRKRKRSDMEKPAEEKAEDVQEPKKEEPEVKEEETPVKKEEKEASENIQKEENEEKKEEKVEAKEEEKVEEKKEEEVPMEEDEPKEEPKEEPKPEAEIKEEEKENGKDAQKDPAPESKSEEAAKPEIAEKKEESGDVDMKPTPEEKEVSAEEPKSPSGKRAKTEETPDELVENPKAQEK